MVLPPPLFSIYAFPSPTLHPLPYVRSFLLGVIGAALPLSSSLVRPCVRMLHSLFIFLQI